MDDTLKTIIALHKKYAPSEEVFNLVFTHCQIVRDIAFQLIDKNSVQIDKPLVQTGALLHDIGVYRLFGADGKLRDGVHYITHGVLGEAILEKEKFPEEVVRFAAHHTGVGLSAHDITSQDLPLPPADYTADTTEELLVMYADKFHSKTTPPYYNSYEWYLADIAKFGADKASKFEHMASMFSIPDLQQAALKYPYAIR